MIRNEKQYQNAKKQQRGFNDVLQDNLKNSVEGDYMALLEMKNVESMQKRLTEEIAEYENLQSGKQTTITLNSLGEIPEMLIKARIAKNWTQADLAQRVGLKEQQIQKYESTDYAGASTRKLLFILDALGIFIPSVSVEVNKPKFDTGMPEEEVKLAQQLLFERKSLLLKTA